MHSHERTLLSKLGFSDVDRKNQRHDRACQYVATGEPLFKLFKPRFESCPKGIRLRHASEVEAYLTKGHGQYKTTIGFVDVVGSVELLFEESVDLSEPKSVFENPRSKPVPPFTRKTVGRWGYFVEVKCSPVPAGDVIRQMRLYREHLVGHPGFGMHGLTGDFYTNCYDSDRGQYEVAERSDVMEAFKACKDMFHAVLVADYDVCPADVAMLRSADIQVLRLGQGFEDWLSEQGSSPGVPIAI